MKRVGRKLLQASRSPIPLRSSEMQPGALPCMVLAIFAACSTAGLADAARAAEAPVRADYPSRPFRLVVPFAPGGSVDVFARLVGQRFTEAMGQPVVVDNRGGAGSILGMEIVARAPADGYNLLVHSAAFTTAAALHTRLSFDPVKDLLPVARLGAGANVLAVHADSPARTLPELLALARSQPGRLNYGSGGPGSSSHLTTEVLLRMAGVDIVHVPYKGLGPAVAALLGGQVQVLLVGMPNVMPQIRAGRLRAVAVSTSKRSPFMPEVPTVSEAGVPGYSASNWWGLWSPGGTSRTIVQRLNDEVARILQGAELRDRLAAEGAEPLGATPEAFARQVRDEIAFWRKVAREAGIKAE
ncbi:MAG: tripartite tricarboxylate transporter substrate binding protein [Proteobacteria bacterium]|nr:tripartite tricarboxylate transporter substrate binding protein [Pseudomonadota bacterium]